MRIGAEVIADVLQMQAPGVGLEPHNRDEQTLLMV